MIQLRTINNDGLSMAIKNLSPEKLEGQVVKNRLIDGSYHIQSIGTPSKTREFEILSNEYQVNMINQAEAVGDQLELQVDEVIYRGFIEAQPTWRRLTIRSDKQGKRLYSTALVFNINSGG